MPTEGETQCARYGVDGRGYGWREFSARTSDFVEYDAGGENPGRDFDIVIYVPDHTVYPDGTPSLPHAMIRFSDRDARFFQLGAADGRGATITASDNGPTVEFEVTGNATSIDTGPIFVRASGQIHCESFVDKQ